MVTIRLAYLEPSVAFGGGSCLRWYVCRLVGGRPAVFLETVFGTSQVRLPVFQPDFGEFVRVVSLVL